MEEGTSSQTASGPSRASISNTPQSQATSTQNQKAQSRPSAIGSSQLSRRRRGLGIVTPNACTECRKKRAKCDGQKPCGRCKSQKDTRCVYEAPIRQSKENLRNEIESLRQRQRSSDQVFAALVRSQLWEDVLTRLRNGHSVENISDWLDQAPPTKATGSEAALTSTMPAYTRPNDLTASVGSHTSPNTVSSSPTISRSATRGSTTQVPTAQDTPNLQSDLNSHSPWIFPIQSQAASTSSSSQTDVMNWTADPGVHSLPQDESLTEGAQLESNHPRFQGLEQILSPLNASKMKSPPGSWTNITTDINLVQHLLALYFCWEYPTFASLSKEHFLRDFQDGRHRYCSPILVNALLALGCRFSSQPMTRANPSDPYTSGDHFFKECQRLLYRETDHHSLTTIQALGIMSIREASCGRDSESWYFAGQSIRLAIEMGLHRTHEQGDEDEIAVQSATFWGAFSLDHAWSLATGSLPQCSYFPRLPPKPAIFSDIEASLWVPYTDDGAPLQRSSEQPSNVRSVYKCFCELSELVHQSLYVLHSPGRPLTARKLLNIYTRYLNWYARIPEVLRLGHNFTPAVLFAHMYYHFAILLLFRPLIKLRIIGSKVCPRDVCSQAADAIQSLLKSYSRLYTLRRTPSFVPYFVLTSAIMHLAIGATSAAIDSKASSEEKLRTAANVDFRVAEALRQGIADLAEMAPCHRFAEQALNIMRFLAKKWCISVDIDQDKTPPEDGDSLVRPYSSSLNFFAPNVQAEDFICGWGPDAEMADVMGDSTVKKASDNLESPLFWPFPLQGRPMLLTGNELERAGFAMQSS